MVLYAKKGQCDDVNNLLDKISKQVKVTSQTIRDIYQIVHKHKDRLLPENLVRNRNPALQQAMRNPNAFGGPV